jgi:hypothetical protein
LLVYTNTRKQGIELDIATMASWTLGKIFSVNEDEVVKKEYTAHEVSAESGSDAEDDEDALEAQAAFKKNKSSSAMHSEIKSSGGSIRRYDEYGDFISRSERARAEKTQQTIMPVSKRADSGTSTGSNKRRVTFKGDGQLLEVKEIPSLTDEAKAACYMTTDNCTFDIFYHGMSYATRSKYWILTLFYTSIGFYPFRVIHRHRY